MGSPGRTSTERRIGSHWLRSDLRGFRLAGVLGNFADVRRGTGPRRLLPVAPETRKAALAICLGGDALASTGITRQNVGILGERWPDKVEDIRICAF